jgi:hypothetical protein
LNNEDFAKEQSLLYPPDGYKRVTKRPRIDGKRRKVTEDNRVYPDAYLTAREVFNKSKADYKSANTEYLEKRDMYV